MNAMEVLAAANDLYDERKNEEKESDEEEEEEGNLRDIIFHLPPREKRSYTQFTDEGDLLFDTEYIQACLWKEQQEREYERMRHEMMVQQGYYYENHQGHQGYPQHENYVANPHYQGQANGNKRSYAQTGNDSGDDADVDNTSDYENDDVIVRGDIGSDDETIIHGDLAEYRHDASTFNPNDFPLDKAVQFDIADGLGLTHNPNSAGSIVHGSLQGLD